LSHSRVTETVIVGGGPAGWMTAAALSKLLGRDYSITLIESEEIGTVGVGEGTIPMIKLYNQALELDEAEFVRRTKASFKMGIQFVDWYRKGESYFHGFGKIGQDLGMVAFYQYWLKMREAGKAGPLDEYSINTVAALQNKFMPAMRDRQNSPFADIAYAFHFDAGLYARYLREYSEARGVTRIEGKVADFTLRGEDGFVQSVTMEDGTVVGGECVAHPKPAPDALALYAERLGAPITHSLMVGDSLNDVGAARNAGCPVVCVPYGYNHGRDIREARPDAVIGSIAELFPLLSKAA